MTLHIAEVFKQSVLNCGGKICYGRSYGQIVNYQTKIKRQGKYENTFL